VIFREELLRMEEHDASLTIRFAITRGKTARPQDIPMRLDEASLRRLLEEWGETPRQVFVCGANRFVEAVTQHSLANDLPAGIIRTERFGGSE
jgi:ferredoxin-NADP reductase